MKIDTNSWHYRLNRKMYGSDIPKSLCPYFWATVLSVFILSWLAPLFNRLVDTKFNIKLFDWMTYHKDLVIYGMCGCLIGYGGIALLLTGGSVGGVTLGIGIGLTIYARFFVTKLVSWFNFEPQKETPKPTKPDSLFKQYLVSKHKMVCPSLDFVDVEKEDFNKHVKKIESQLLETMKQNIKKTEQEAKTDTNKYLLSDD